MKAGSAAEFYKQLELEHINCPLCSRDNQQVLCENDRYEMGVTSVGCEYCGLIFVNPRPTKSAIEEFYKNHYRNFYEKIDRPTKEYLANGPYLARANFVSDSLRDILLSKPGGSVLDIGCADGTLLDELGRRHSGLCLFGIEPDPKFADFARARTSRMNIVSQSFEEFFEGSAQQYDVITITHVLEHLLDPVSVLKSIADILKEDGYIYIEVPNIADPRCKGLGNIHLAHLFSFDPQSLATAANVAGLSVVEEFYDNLPALTPAMAILCQRGALDARRRIGRPAKDIEQSFKNYKRNISGRKTLSERALDIIRTIVKN